ncbi:MAG: GDSL-type esterase/lipase family protein [Candidatus Adiutrix sp.]|jgi:lysophospholipase L1-like esterase|nr:GDSL-type esterase/lipase family protein [Candidatus Adiutrix sp.]
MTSVPAALALVAALCFGLAPAAAADALKRNGSGKMTAEKTIVMLGDSLTFRNDWGRAFPGTATLNFGLDGDTVAGVWSRLDEAVGAAPAVIFLQIGINDFLRGASPGEIVAGHRRIWRELAERLPGTRLYVVSLLPYMEAALPGLPPNLVIRDLNLELAALAAEAGLTFIDVFPLLADEDLQLRPEMTSDGVHLTPAAYRLLENRLRPFIN